MPIFRSASVVILVALIDGCGGTTSTASGNSPVLGADAGATGGAGGSSGGSVGHTGGSISSGGVIGGSAGAAGTGPTYSCNGKQLPIPVNHRPTVETCPTSKVAVACQDGGTSPCGGVPCMSDADCSASFACTCDGTRFGWSHASTGNTCVASECRTDVDCPSGYCSPSAAPGASFYGVTGFFCHTCDDTCTNDSDCNGDFGPGYCAHQSTGVWACSYGSVAG